MAGKADTQYSERERLVNMKVLANFSTNPFAALLVLEDYVKNVSPLPIKYVWEAAGKDIIMDAKADDKGKVELYLVTAGYVGKKIGDISKMDTTALNLLCMSYYQYQRPLPLSFQLGNSVEFHFRTKGISDFEKKNPLREIWDPTK